MPGRVQVEGVMVGCDLEPVHVSPCPVLVIEAKVSAGFPSPAADYVEGRIDLTEILVPHPSATFTLRIAGHSMQRAGIHDGDLALVDRSLQPRHDDVVVAVIDGELTCKRLVIRKGRTILAPDSEDPSYRAIEVTGRPDFEIWGVITSTIRFHRK